jgi:hypothetical protein
MSHHGSCATPGLLTLLDGGKPLGLKASSTRRPEPAPAAAEWVAAEAEWAAARAALMTARAPGPTTGSGTTRSKVFHAPAGGARPHLYSVSHSTEVKMRKSTLIEVVMTALACVMSLPASATDGSEASSPAPCPSSSSARASGTGTLSGGQATYSQQQSHTGNATTSVTTGPSGPATSVSVSASATASSGCPSR